MSGRPVPFRSIDVTDERQGFLSQVNLARYHGQAQGHYESFFQRANHPTRPLAFWIRYTLFSPKARPGDAVGELWAIVFNGETNRHLAFKQEFPIGECIFGPSEFHVRIGNAELDSRRLHGGIRSGAGAISWDLSFSSEADPVLLLPIGLYRTRLPAAKSLVAMPLARYSGRLSLDGETIGIADWIGSQNHNWGSRHTDSYAWGQVAGFDTHPQSFLEVATAKLKIGPLWTPPITPMVLRHKGREYALNGLLQSVRASGSFDCFNWRFASKTPQVDIEGTISAPRTAFVGLNYRNPPGGSKHCLNTKIASCRLQVRDRMLGTTELLETANRAAFEILTDDRSHGIPISA
jgi:hypothetical protein